VKLSEIEKISQSSLQPSETFGEEGAVNVLQQAKSDLDNFYQKQEIHSPYVVTHRDIRHSNSNSIIHSHSFYELLCCHNTCDAEYLIEADTQLANLHFLGTMESIKSYLYHNGWDKYNFMDKLAKAQAIIYDSNTMKIEGRSHLLEMILQERHPIFIEDLAIDADDIIEAGITDDPERAEYLMTLLPDIVHHTEKKNTRETLLKYAKRFHKSKAHASLRKVKWLR